MEKQCIHVRKLFSLVVPLRTVEVPNVETNHSSSNFGLTITFPNNPSPCQYRIHMYSDFKRLKGPSHNQVDYSSLLGWAKTAPFSFIRHPSDASIISIELQLKIGPGFDFRKVPKRYVRFEIECYSEGTLQSKCTSKLCQVLSKRRVATLATVEQGMQTLSFNFKLIL